MLLYYFYSFIFLFPLFLFILSIMKAGNFSDSGQAEKFIRFLTCLIWLKTFLLFCIFIDT